MTSPDPDEQTWIPERPPFHLRRHNCEDSLPLHPRGEEGDLWLCPSCRRRWRLMDKADERMLTGVYFEGVSIIGPDDSTYWRPSRVRLIGRLGT